MDPPEVALAADWKWGCGGAAPRLIPEIVANFCQTAESISVSHVVWCEVSDVQTIQAYMHNSVKHMRTEADIRNIVIIDGVVFFGSSLRSARCDSS